jgi:hypothetical protein
MPAYRGLYVKGSSATPSVGTTPLEARLALAGQIAENSPGVPRAGVLPQSAANLVTATATTAPLSYNIAPCNVIISRVAGEGVYTLSLVGTTVANTIAPPASNSRWDLIYVMQNDLEKGDADNGPVVGVINGAAAAAPTKPYASVPAGGFVLAEAQIFSGTTATNGGTNTLANVWAYTALRGHPVICRTLAERNTITSPFIGQRVIRLDRNNHEQTWGGSAWKWTSKPERYTASTFDTSSAAGSRLIASVDNWPGYSWNIKTTIRGALTVLCPTVASGTQSINVAVSIGQASVSTAQGKGRLNWTPGFSSNNQTGIAEAQDIVIAGTSSAPRLWIENVAGALAMQPSAGAYAYLYADVLPADD